MAGPGSMAQHGPHKCIGPLAVLGHFWGNWQRGTGGTMALHGASLTAATPLQQQHSSSGNTGNSSWQARPGPGACARPAAAWWRSKGNGRGGWVAGHCHAGTWRGLHAWAAPGPPLHAVINCFRIARTKHLQVRPARGCIGLNAEHRRWWWGGACQPHCGAATSAHSCPQHSAAH